jgi:hypothetical protein
MQIERSPLTRGIPPPDPRSLCPLSSTEIVEPPPPQKFPGYATVLGHRFVGWDIRIKLLCVLIELEKKSNVIIASGEANPLALLNGIFHNVSLSSSEGTVTKKLLQSF